MALNINLYHEIQRARKQEQFDPLKISMMSLGVVALCLAAWYLMRLTETNKAREQYANHQAEMAKLQPQAAAAKISEAELTKTLQLADLFTKRIEERFYWAPVVDIVAGVIPRNVQITKLVGDVSSSETPRRIGLSIDGIAAGEHPRKVAEEIRLAVIDAFGRKFKGVTASFRSLDDSIERVNLDGSEMGTAIFSIGVSFTSAGVDAAPEPPKTAQR